MKLIELAKVLRSKNAGPLYLTFDIILENRQDLETVLRSVNPEVIAQAYGVKPGQVSIIPYEIVNSVKITIPRKCISGSVDDTDIYGCQQHMPLAQLPVIEKE